MGNMASWLTGDAAIQLLEPAVAPTPGNASISLIGSANARASLYAESIEHPDEFWSKLAKSSFYWKKTWEGEKVCSYNFDKSKGPIFTKWFEGGLTNVCYNALDRYLPTHNDRVCFYWEGNDPNRKEVITYKEMHERVIRMASVLRHVYHIKKGDTVALYLPMIPFTVVTMMACARIGAVPTVIFSGFSSNALAGRIERSNAKLVITADASFRAEKPILLKKIVDEALKQVVQESSRVIPTLVFPNSNREHCTMEEGRDRWYDDVEGDLTTEQRETCEVEWVDAEHILFILYTSGSTGKPKAVVHTTGGYMVYAATTFRCVFDYHASDVYFCTGDVGWITGHTYVLYGPMLNCATSVLFEGIFNYPENDRWWDLVEKYKVSLFYTAPTAVRALMKFGDEPIKKHDLSKLRVLGSVGEPINVEAWEWYYNVVGGGHADIVDTWWQTESGGHMLTPFPGCNAMKPGCATLPFFGVAPVILDPLTMQELEGKAEGLVAIKKPWPGMARTLLGDHQMYEQQYFSSNGYYVSGDGGRRDVDGYFWITGRVDDVLNVSGHRLGTSEVEDAATTHPAVVECAAVGIPHAIKGEGIYLFLAFHANVEVTPALLNEVRARVRDVIGPLATPDKMQPAPDGLPKTRSGKIVRRVLRKIASHSEADIGDVTTLNNPDVVVSLIKARDIWTKESRGSSL